MLSRTRHHMFSPQPRSKSTEEEDMSQAMSLSKISKKKEDDYRMVNRNRQDVKDQTLLHLAEGQNYFNQNMSQLINGNSSYSGFNSTLDRPRIQIPQIQNTNSSMVKSKNSESKSDDDNDENSKRFAQFMLWQSQQQPHAKEVCKMYDRFGECQYGDTCRFEHNDDDIDDDIKGEEDGAQLIEIIDQKQQQQQMLDTGKKSPAVKEPLTVKKPSAGNNG